METIMLLVWLVPTDEYLEHHGTFDSAAMCKEAGADLQAHVGGSYQMMEWRCIKVVNRLFVSPRPRPRG